MGRRCWGRGDVVDYVHRSVWATGNDNDLAQFVNGNDWRAWPIFAFLGAYAAGSVIKREINGYIWRLTSGEEHRIPHAISTNLSVIYSIELTHT